MKSGATRATFCGKILLKKIYVFSGTKKIDISERDHGQCPPKYATGRQALYIYRLFTNFAWKSLW